MALTGHTEWEHHPLYFLGDTFKLRTKLKELKGTRNSGILHNAAKGPKHSSVTRSPIIFPESITAFAPTLFLSLSIHKEWDNLSGSLP